MSAALGIGMTSIILNNKKSFKEADASSVAYYSGLYEKVTNVSDIDVDNHRGSSYEYPTCTVYSYCF